MPEALGIRLDMDGKGRFIDDIFVERQRRRLDYEELYCVERLRFSMFAGPIEPAAPSSLGSMGQCSPSPACPQPQPQPNGSETMEGKWTLPCSPSPPLPRVGGRHPGGSSLTYSTRPLRCPQNRIHLAHPEYRLTSN